MAKFDIVLEPVVCVLKDINFNPKQKWDIYR